MEHLFQTGMQPPRFQGRNKHRVDDRVDDEELSQNLTQCPSDKEPDRDVFARCSSDECSLFSTSDSHPFDTSDSHDILSEPEDIILHNPQHDTLDWSCDDEFLTNSVDFYKTSENSFSLLEPGPLMSNIVNDITLDSEEANIFGSSHASQLTGCQLRLPDLDDSLLSEDETGFQLLAKGSLTGYDDASFDDEPVPDLRDIQMANPIDSAYLTQERQGPCSVGKAWTCGFDNEDDHHFNFNFPHKIAGISGDGDIDLFSEADSESISNLHLTGN
ncbi:hypothetical protein AX17_005288 [Amanita inopinata Kibby_2008]|nr:hypothetical protein AX17_005288 [Amanita inopinata Kibby_2008]